MIEIRNRFRSTFAGPKVWKLYLQRGHMASRPRALRAAESFHGYGALPTVAGPTNEKSVLGYKNIQFFDD